MTKANPRSTLAQDRRGVTAIAFAASTVGLLCVAGLAIDSGNVETANRALQGCTDLAAISAASNLATAQNNAVQTASLNGYGAGDVASVVPGIYTPNTNVPAAQRFQPAAAGAANAVQVTMTHAQPLYFSNIFNLASGKGRFASTAALSTQAIATVQRAGAFDIGATVAAYNGGIINGLLGATIGSGASLSLLSYTALAGAQVNLFGFGQALAAQVGQVGGTYGQAYSGTISLSAYLTALQQADPSVAPELQALVNAAAGSNATVNLSELVDTGPFAQQLLSAPLPTVSASASALSLVQSALQLGGTPHLISFNLSAPVSGIASAAVNLTIGEPPQGTSLMAVGQQGSSVSTAQIRLALQVQLSAPVLGNVVSLPVYVEVGYGTASLSNLGCVPLDSTATTASLAVTPGLVNAYIGNVSNAALLNYGAEPAPTTATLLTLLNIATVTGHAQATVGNTAPVTVAYSGSDIQNMVVKTTTTNSFAGSLVSALLGNLSLQVNAIGLSVAPPGLAGTVAATLSAAAPAVDTVLGGVLQSLGVGVGQASTWMTGTACGAATLSG